MFWLLLHFGLTETQAFGDETISGYASRDAVYELVEMDGQFIDTEITIAFPGKGEVTGKAPCNRYRARQTVPLPWIEIGEITATKRACADLELEQRYFSALQTMTLAEIGGDILILSNDAGDELVFAVQP